MEYRRLQIDHVDILFCHRLDPFASLEEAVWALSDVISQGKALLGDL